MDSSTIKVLAAATGASVVAYFLYRRRFCSSQRSTHYSYSGLAKQLGTGCDAPLLPAPSLPADRPVREYVTLLEKHGCIVIRGALPKEAVCAFKAEHDRALEMLQPAMQRLDAEPFDQKESFYHNEETVDGLLVQRVAKSRFVLTSVDKRDGGAMATEKTRMAEFATPLVMSALVRDILETAMCMAWRMGYVGTLPAYPGAGPGVWHRDINVLFSDERFDLSLPDFYYNLLVPLDPVTRDNGTEMVLGSHKLTTDRLHARRPRTVPDANPGDVILFNGKTVHRGRPNQGQHAKMRSVLYAVFSAFWYEAGRPKEKDGTWISDKEYDD